MNSGQRCTVTIGRTRVDVPLCDDPETSEDIAKAITDRLARIEEESTIVDTQKFAVIAAYELAMECYRLKQQHEEDTQDMVKALERLCRELRQLVERYHLDMSGRSDSE